MTFIFFPRGCNTPGLLYQAKKVTQDSSKNPWGLTNCVELWSLWRHSSPTVSIQPGSLWFWTARETLTQIQGRNATPIFKGFTVEMQFDRLDSTSFSQLSDSIHQLLYNWIFGQNFWIDRIPSLIWCFSHLGFLGLIPPRYGAGKSQVAVNPHILFG